MNQKSTVNWKAENRLPSVSVCTLARNQSHLMPLLEECITSQAYPDDLIEWITVDDSSEQGRWRPSTRITVPTTVRYLHRAATLDQKRKIGHSFCSGDLIIHMDPGFIYANSYIKSAAETLRASSKLTSGLSRIPVLSLHENRLWIFDLPETTPAFSGTLVFCKEQLNSSPKAQGDHQSPRKKAPLEHTLENIDKVRAKENLIYVAESLNQLQLQKEYHFPIGEWVELPTSQLSPYAAELVSRYRKALTKNRLRLIDKEAISKRIDIGFAIGEKLIPGLNMHDKCEIRADGVIGSASQSFDTLRIARMGRFSNNFLQLLHGCLAAKALGANTVLVPDQFAGISHLNAKYSDIEFASEGAFAGSVKNQLTSYCWFPSGALKEVYAGVTIGHARQVCRDFIRPQFFLHFPTISSIRCMQDEKAKVAVHIRSGDLFQTSYADGRPRMPHPFYVQPPFKYYVNAIEHALSFDNVISLDVVIEDRRNPVTGALVAWLDQAKVPYILHESSFQDALCTLLDAHKIISAYGSVIELVGMLSSKLRTVYSFNDYGRWAERELGGHAQYHLIGDIKEVIRVKAASPYIRPGTWNASEEQLRLMLEQQVEPIGSRIEGTWSACLDEALFFTGKEGL